MNNLRMLLFLSLVIVMLYGGSAQGQALTSQKIIDVRMRASDARLDTPVNFDADRMCLGELLEKVSAQTGVSVSIPAEDLCSGIPITCHVKNIPLATFLNSVWSLVGFSKATWQITSDAPHQSPGYQLLPTVASRALAERLQRETDQYTGKLFAVLLKMSAMTPKERQADIHELAQALLMEKDSDAKFYVEDSPGMAQYWSVIGLFATALTPDQQVQIGKGETIFVPLVNLDADTQKMLRAEGGHVSFVVNGVRTDNEPDTVRFSYNRDGGDNRSVARELSIGVGTTTALPREITVGFSRKSYMGVMEMNMKGLVLDGWILPGDLRHAEPEKLTVSALPELADSTLWRHVAQFDRLLTQLADAQQVSYIGVVPDDADNQIEVSVGKSAQQCLEDLRTRESLMHKWRDGVLLFNYPVWFLEDEARYPYALVKQLRASKQRNAGSPLTIPDIANAVITLNDAQMKRLASEFPQIGANKTKRPVFVFYQRYPAILSDEGLPVDLNMLVMLKDLKLMPTLAEQDALERIRIIERASPQINDGRRLYRIQIQTTKQKDWRQVGELTILPDRNAPR